MRNILAMNPRFASRAVPGAALERLPTKATEAVSRSPVAIVCGVLSS
jgi:hypothetical protein